MERILVVDDDIGVCNMLRRYFLLENRYEVYVAHDGESAVSKVKEIRPHIVLLDIMMPGMGGIDTLKEIKKVDPAVGVIMITALADEELARRALALGAYDYITKPFDLDYLETVIMVKIVDLLG